MAEESVGIPLSARASVGTFESFGLPTWDYARPDPPPVGTFVAPPGARQGPTTWWVIEARVRISVGTGGQGLGYLSCSTNDQVVLQLKIKRTGSTTEVTTYGLVDGLQTIEPRDGIYEASYSNYLRDKGIEPGPNTVSCSLKRDDSLPVAHAEVLGQSTVFTTAYGTEPLELQLEVPPGRYAPIGKPLKIAYRLSTKDTRAISNVRVRVAGAQGIKTLEPTETSFGAVSGSRDGFFTVVPTTSGEHRVTLMAVSEINNPVLVFTFVAGGGGLQGGSWIRMVGLGAFGIGITLVMLGRRRQKGLRSR